MRTLLWLILFLFGARVHSSEIDNLNVQCYNARADYWDRMPFADFLPEQILLHHSPEVGTRTLDIGSGTGMLAEYLMHQGFDLLCIDPSEEMVRRCRAKHLPTLQTTLQNYNTDEKFGLILAVLSLIHIPKSEIESQLSKIANCLHPGGTFVLALIKGEGECLEKNTLYPRFFSYYTKEEVTLLTQKDFSCVFERETKGPIIYLVYIFKKR